MQVLSIYVQNRILVLQPRGESYVVWCKSAPLQLTQSLFHWLVSKTSLVSQTQNNTREKGLPILTAVATLWNRLALQLPVIVMASPDDVQQDRIGFIR